ncbi:MAG: glycine--tRNA ligase subunit beta, partial [Chloroflexota bacterium]
MTKPLSFQDMTLKLLSFWADHGCLIWQPYNVQVGAGTFNPATVLRVLGPEPWNVAYIEPSVRPDDGRFGENPNRMQLHYQLQVILKPDPGNPQELYLDSLKAIGIDARKHDIRFVEDNWESPALGAWGLGWEVWLDGQEITQYTYFQQAGGMELDPVAVEITYGLERILIALQGRDSVWDLDWGQDISYGDVLLQSEKEHCDYYFNVANVSALKEIFDHYESEAKRVLDAGLVIPAHDYVLKCSHLFNVMDTRGAIGVTERATYFRRMRNIARRVSRAYVAQREEMGFPFIKEQITPDLTDKVKHEFVSPSEPSPFLLEIGTEELPTADVDSAINQFKKVVPQWLKDLRLEHGQIQVTGTPRRITVQVDALAPKQQDSMQEIKGPPVDRAFDASGSPTRAVLGFAQRHHVEVDSLAQKEIGNKRYVVALVSSLGQAAPKVLSESLPSLISSLRFGRPMRWLTGDNVSFSRPIRWFVSFLGDEVVPFNYAGLESGRISRLLRPQGSPEIAIDSASSYLQQMAEGGVVLDPAERAEMILEQAHKLADKVGGEIDLIPGLLEEVTNLVEKPTAIMGQFSEEHLALPRDILVTVMRKHQRYFPVISKDDGSLLPYFVAVRNGDGTNEEVVREGYEQVIKARFADAEFFFQDDTQGHLESFLPRLDTLTFQEQLGSMLDKTRRLEGLADYIGSQVSLSRNDQQTVQRASTLCKADLATKMVVEMTSLQGTVGRDYAELSGESPQVAQAIAEHYMPTSQGGAIPTSPAGAVLSLADRIDSLVGLFAVGMRPTGSADPYGLRRAGLGVIQILTGIGWNVQLSDIL